MDDFERPKTRIQWMLGNSCNYKCSYCLDLLHRGDHPFPDDELMVEVCKDIITHYDELGRDAIFEFVGGEPTLIDKIPNIGQRLHNYPTNIVLKTNGSASLEWWKYTRRYLSDVIISVHKQFADVQHIEKVVRLLQEDKDFHPINVQVLFPVTQREDSWDWGFENVHNFRKKYGVGDIQLLYSNFGKGSNAYLPYNEKQKKQYNKFYNIEEPELKEETDQFCFKDFTCYAGIETLVIDSLGNVTRGWCLQGGKIGNIYKMPVIWPTDTIVCQKQSCNNGFDRLAKKEN